MTARSMVTRLLVVIFVVALVGFCVFLYLVPPFFTASPETFSKPTTDAAPGVDGIADPTERLIAARGRYLVVTAGCMGCHQLPTPQGPDLSRYLAGGMKLHTEAGTFVTRNLTPDAETGIGNRTEEDVKRILRSGIYPDGRVVSYRVMPWGSYTSWTEEDRHAVVVYLRHLPAVVHPIPNAVLTHTPLSDALAIEEVYAGRDYGGAPKK